MLGEDPEGMDSTVTLSADNSSLRTEFSSTTEATGMLPPDYLLKNYLLIIIPSVFICIFLIILFIVIIKKIMNSRRFDPKQLETYSSVNYDDEIIDDDLGSTDDLMYTSCKLLVGGEYEENSELTNSEPEYDCMSVDVSVNGNDSSIVDWNKGKLSKGGAAQLTAQNSKALPPDFWKR